MAKIYVTAYALKTEEALRRPAGRARERAPLFTAKRAARLLVSLHLIAAAGAAAYADSAGSAAGLIAAMARFDRAFIPALAITNQGAPERSRKAVSRLKDEWTRFEAGFGSFEETPRWRDALARIGGEIGKAAEYVGRGEFVEAHEALEEVRNAFIALREERSLDYYLDFLNRYHEAMERTLREAAEAASGGLDDARRGNLLKLEGEARKLWEALSEAPFDAAMFGFDRAKTRELEYALADVGKSLDALRGAFCEKDGEALIRAALGLRPPFVKAFLMFGDFGGLE